METMKSKDITSEETNERPRELLDLLSNKTGKKQTGESPEEVKDAQTKRPDGWDNL